jgi:hypothetical protein
MATGDFYGTYTISRREETTTISEGIWRSHFNGKEFSIKTMTNEHLLNTIIMIERGYDGLGGSIPEYCKSKYSELKKEAAKRGLTDTEDGWDL